MAARSVQRERKSRVMTLYSPRTSAAISMSTAHIFEFQQWIFHLLCNNLQSKVVFNTQFSFSNWGLKYIAAKFTHLNVYLSFPKCWIGVQLSLLSQKWKAYETNIHLPGPGCPHKRGEWIKRRVMDEATKTPITTPKESKDSTMRSEGIK